jgi:hypothetical protein
MVDSPQMRLLVFWLVWFRKENEIKVHGPQSMADSSELKDLISFGR